MHDILDYLSDDPSLAFSFQICINKPGTFMCDCKEGFKAFATGKCVDVNECLLVRQCSALTFIFSESRPTTIKESSTKVVNSVTRWLNYLFNIWPFVNNKNLSNGIQSTKASSMFGHILTNTQFLTHSNFNDKTNFTTLNNPIL